MDNSVSGNISASPDQSSVIILEQEAVPRLQRDTLNLFEVISGTLANIAPAASLFLTLTLVVAAMGTRAPWAFLVGGVAILATGNSLAEFSKFMPSAGSYISNIGIGSVPLLVVYGLMNIALPIYMLKKQFLSFNLFKHVLVPIVGTLIVLYGIYEYVQPDQPPPSNTFWIYIAALIIIALVGTAIVLVRNPEAIKRIGSVLAD